MKYRANTWGGDERIIAIQKILFIICGFELCKWIKNLKRFKVDQKSQVELRWTINLGQVDQKFIQVNWVK